MKTDENDIPSFLLGKAQDDAVLWGNLTDRFGHLCDFVENMRLETVEEAVGKKLKGQWYNTAPKWEDQEVGITCRAWNLIPYIDALDQAEIKERIEAAKCLIPFLKSCFEERVLTVEFLKMWGLFSCATGAIEFIYFHNSDVGRKRLTKASGDVVQKRSGDHKRWLAHYILRFYVGRGSRGNAEFAVEQLIKGIIDHKIPVDWDLQWFNHFLDFKGNKEANPNYGSLRAAYREREFSLLAMEKLISQEPGDIPPLDLILPETLR